MFEIVKSWFWHQDFWLPPNETWSNLVSNDRIQYPDHKDLIFIIPFCSCLLVLRYFLEKYCFSPFGQSLGITYKLRKTILHEPELERLFKLNGKPGQKEIEKGAAILSKSEREIARWFRIRRFNEKPSKLKKFCENSFRFVHYSFSFCFGLTILWNKEWLWDVDACWHLYPHQGIDRGIWWYYNINTSYLCALAISHFFDVKHKDFWPMFVHHIATIILLLISWIINIVRIGTLILILHDFADIFLELTKMMLYAKYYRICDILFIMFTVSWVVTRLGIFPFLVYNSIVGPKVELFPAGRIAQFLLFVLLILHLYWTNLIIKVLRKSTIERKMKGDVRSSSDDDDDFSDSSRE